MSPKPIHVTTDGYDETNKRLSLFMRTRFKAKETFAMMYNSRKSTIQNKT